MYRLMERSFNEIKEPISLIILTCIYNGLMVIHRRYALVSIKYTRIYSLICSLIIGLGFGYSCRKPILRSKCRIIKNKYKEEKNIIYSSNEYRNIFKFIIESLSIDSNIWKLQYMRTKDISVTSTMSVYRHDKDNNRLVRSKLESLEVIIICFV